MVEQLKIIEPLTNPTTYGVNALDAFDVVIPSMPGQVNQQSGIVSILSSDSLDETVERLKDLLQSKGITLFSLVDHSGEAEKVGMKMPPTKLLIFGSPKGGTPLMLAAPSIAIDLPLKILVWEDTEGKVRLSFNSSDYLARRHGIPQDLLKNIAVVGTLVKQAAK